MKKSIMAAIVLVVVLLIAGMIILNNNTDGKVPILSRLFSPEEAELDGDDASEKLEEFVVTLSEDEELEIK